MAKPKITVNSSPKHEQLTFIGRKWELETLQRLLKKKVASFVVIKGRRRIGKSRLAEEFGKNMRTIILTGLPPEEKITDQDQREYFAQQLSLKFHIPPPRANDWTELFWALAERLQEGRVLIVLDEISWMGSKDPTFLGKLKGAWDLLFSKNPKLILIVTGSISSWIDKNLLSSTGFVERISLDLELKELPLPSCNDFWGRHKSRVSAYEKFKFLAVSGGVPRYLEEIIPEEPVENLIQALCFQPEGFLFGEFNRIFSDLFSKRSQTYRQIVESLVDGPVEQEKICKALGVEKGGTISDYLTDLELAGFISRDYTWNIKGHTQSKLSHYRLKDNYLRFYLKYIAPNRDRIAARSYQFSQIGSSSILGLQFENLILNNRHHLWELLKIEPNEIIWDNPYFQRATVKHRDCQIDYLIQTRNNVLWICEIKFSKSPIGSQVIGEVENKIQRLRCPKHFSYRAVLIHVNGITEELEEAGFFSNILNFAQLL